MDTAFFIVTSSSRLQMFATSADQVKAELRDRWKNWNIVSVEVQRTETFMTTGDVRSVLPPHERQ